MVEQNNGIINVDVYVARYGIKSPEAIETLKQYPVLCYLLGNITAAEIVDKRPDGIERNIWFLTEGSGMFGLKNREDAERWKGIFNHILGSSRQVYWLANKLKSSTPEQKQKFIDAGFDFTQLDHLSAEQLRDFMLVSHAGRRQMDEYNWHGLRNNTHLTNDSYENTLGIMRAEKAPELFIDLLRVESNKLLKQTVKEGRLPNIVDNILTYCDWTFGQKPNTLEERFTGLRNSKRLPDEELALLEGFGNSFENVLKQVFGKELWQEMASVELPKWERQIRDGYWQESVDQAPIFASERS